MRAARGWTVRVMRVEDDSPHSAWDVVFVAMFADGRVTHSVIGCYDTRDEARRAAPAELARLRLDPGAVARLRQQSRRAR